MKKSGLLLVAVMLLSSAPGSALEITAVAPQRALPATEVTVNGGPFSPQTQLFLGEQSVPLSRAQPGRLAFIVPALPPGNYTLAIHDQGQSVFAHLIFEVLAPPPEIAAIAPDNLDVCIDDAERIVQVSGRHFLADSRLLLDGKIVDSHFIDAGTLEFSVPALPAGVYGVEARNPDGTASLPHSLWINSIPEILSVERGEDLVNNYDMILHGKNFFYNSILLIREPENPATGRGYRVSTLQAGIGDLSQRSNAMSMPGESLLYENCETLVYRRYPLNMQDKELQLQVINPDGKKTVPFTVTLP